VVLVLSAHSYKTITLAGRLRPVGFFSKLLASPCCNYLAVWSPHSYTYYDGPRQFTRAGWHALDPAPGVSRAIRTELPDRY